MRDLFQNAASLTSSEGNGAQTANGDSHLLRLYAPALDEPWFISLIRSSGEAIRPPKLPPLLVTCKPIAVKEIWGLYNKDKKSNLMSLAIHASVVILLFTAASSKAVQSTAKRAVSLIAPDIAPYIPKMAQGKQQMGGGGAAAIVPPRLPARVVSRSLP